MKANTVWNSITLLAGGVIAFVTANQALIPAPYNLYVTAGVTVLTALYHLFQPSPSAK